VELSFKVQNPVRTLVHIKKLWHMKKTCAKFQLPFNKQYSFIEVTQNTLELFKKKIQCNIW